MGVGLQIISRCILLPQPVGQSAIGPLKYLTRNCWCKKMGHIHWCHILQRLANRLLVNDGEDILLTVMGHRKSNYAAAKLLYPMILLVKKYLFFWGLSTAAESSKDAVSTDSFDSLPFSLSLSLSLSLDIRHDQPSLLVILLDIPDQILLVCLCVRVF